MRTAVDAAARLVTRPGPSFRVVRWTTTSVRQVVADLRHDGLSAISRVPPPPAGPRGDRAVVVAALRCLRANCLVRAAVLQQWDAAHGDPRALRIGVRRSDGRLEAHAWLDGDRVGEFSELHSRPAPSTSDAGARTAP